MFAERIKDVSFCKHFVDWRNDYRWSLKNFNNFAIVYNEIPLWYFYVCMNNIHINVRIINVRNFTSKFQVVVKKKYKKKYFRR